MQRSKLYKVTTNIKISSSSTLSINAIAKTPLDAMYNVTDMAYNGNKITTENITGVSPLMNGEYVYGRYSYDDAEDLNPYYIKPEESNNNE